MIKFRKNWWLQWKWIMAGQNSILVFCYQNCSYLMWEKIVLVIEKNFWNLRLKAKNLQKIWDHNNNLFEQFLVTECFFNLFLRFNKLEHLEFELETILGFRNMQEKLANQFYHDLLASNLVILRPNTQKILEFKNIDVLECSVPGFDYCVDNESLDTLYWLKWGFVFMIIGYIYSQKCNENAKKKRLIYFELWKLWKHSFVYILKKKVTRIRNVVTQFSLAFFLHL